MMKRREFDSIVRGLLTEVRPRLKQRVVVAELLPVVQELEDQAYRIEKVLIHIERTNRVGSLMTVAEGMKERVSALRREAGVVDVELAECESINTIKETVSRFWNWLRRNEKRVAALEQLVYYGS